MKNKIEYKVICSIVAYSTLLLIIEILAQAGLSCLYQMDFWNNFKEAYIDISGHFADSPGQLILHYSDLMRIVVAGILLFPYMFCIWNMIHKNITKPLLSITDQILQMKNDALLERIDLPVQYEFIQLEDAYNDLMDRVEQATFEQQKIEKEKMLLISGMAHDLKTPITTIRGYAQLFRDGLVETEEQRAEYLEAIYLKANQMNELISALFDYLRLGTGEYQLVMEKIDLQEIIRESIGLVYLDFERKGIEVRFVFEDQTIYVLGDKMQLERVFENLFSNALKYTKQSDCVQIQVSCTAKGWVKVIVEDTGEAISKEIEPFIFDPFVMGDYARKSGCGNGLGLSIASKIMKLHEGEIILKTMTQEQFTKQFILTFPTVE